MKVVINSDFGGFGLSDEAMRMYSDLILGDKNHLLVIRFSIRMESLKTKKHSGKATYLGMMKTW